MLTEHGYIELASLLVGGGCAVMVLRVGMVKGIGPQIRLALALCLLCPTLLILGMEKILNSETIAAIVGTLIGAGVPATGGGGGAATGTEKTKQQPNQSG